MRCASSISAEAKGVSRVPLTAVRGAALAALLATAAFGVSEGAPGNRDIATARAVRIPPGVRVLFVPGTSDPGKTIDELERAGYHVDVALSPGTYFVRSGARPAALPAGALDVTVEGQEDLAFTPEESAEDAPFGDRGDVVLPERPRDASGIRMPLMQAGALLGLPQGARWEDTSELMVGRVAVPILFPESDGEVDRNEFDWTPALQDSVIRSAVRGCLKWTAFAAARGVPLTYVLEVHPNLPTRYEPIRRSAGQTGLWMAEAMETILGYEGDADLMAYELANGARARLGAQWSALCFAVQNDTTAISGFPDGTSERARLGGPWFIVAVRHANATTSTLDYYLGHEMAHMFWALDEYPANNAWWACTLTSGYFDQQNSNSDLPAHGYCGSTAQCLMRGNWPDSLCSSTARQIGWVDLDLNGVLDLYETRPDVRPDSTHYDAATGQPVTIRGKASDVAWPNKNPYRFGAGDSISIATIDSISYRTDGGPWAPLAPQDGIFDSGEERFVLVLPPMTLGNHLIEFQARNSNGKSLPIPSSTVVGVAGGSGTVGESGVSGPAPPWLEAGPIPSAGGVRFALGARGPGRAEARLYDVSGREIRSWRIDVAVGGSSGWEWDGRLRHGAPAPGGVYFLVVQIDGRRLDRRIVLLR